MNSDYVEKALFDTNTILHGHFILKSGQHSGLYVNKDAIYSYPQYVHGIAQLIAHRIVQDYPLTDMVIGPAIGGAILAMQVATELLALGQRVRYAFTEKDENGVQVLKRNYAAVAGISHAVIVEDVMTTGKSVRDTVLAVKAAGGSVLSVIAVVNRGKVTADGLGVVAMEQLYTLDIPTYAEETVPLWLRELRVDTHVGHGTEYLKIHPEPVLVKMPSASDAVAAALIWSW